MTFLTTLKSNPSCITVNILGIRKHGKLAIDLMNMEGGATSPKGRYSNSETLCPFCEGKGRVASRMPGARGRKGGNVAYLKSLEPGAMSMADRGRKGGRPRALTLIDLGGREPSS